MTTPEGSTTSSVAPTSGSAALSAIGPGDTTGTETLARYIYQCKVAVQRWLGSLAGPPETQIVCEFVDDITTVTNQQLLFTQVKTRDRGVWTVSRVLMPGGGVDALIRSYQQARAAGCSEKVRLELVLEGPEGERADTRAFFADPSLATEAQRATLTGLGLDAVDVDDFLGRLTIQAQYHARSSIDGVTLQMLMAIAPTSSAAIQDTYDRLLERSIAAHLGLAAQSTPGSPLILQPRNPPDIADPVREHALTRTELLTLLPFAPQLAEEQRELLVAANDGALAMTDLEFKLRVAGASDLTVSRAQSKRAQATAILETRPSLDDDVDDAVLDLEDRLLEYADGVAADVVASASNPASGHRPAEAIYGRLLQQILQLSALDRDSVFEGDGEQILGYLCEISDRCKYAWRVP